MTGDAVASNVLLSSASQFVVGGLVTYHQNGATLVAGLVDGNTYQDQASSPGVSFTLQKNDLSGIRTIATGDYREALFTPVTDAVTALSGPTAGGNLLVASTNKFRVGDGVALWKQSAPTAVPGLVVGTTYKVRTVTAASFSLYKDDITAADRTIADAT